jgi:hypothetical protein
MPGLASSPFAHHYSGNRGCFLFLRVLRCFTSPRYHQPPYAFRRRRPPMTGARFPHSETPGSQPGCRLPGAYRRLQRPSSAPGAKASTVCPKKLDTTKHALQLFRKETGDARVHCAVLKKRTETSTPQQHPPPRGNRPAKKKLAPRKAPVPSGPNSVPSPRPPGRPPFSTPETGGLLAGPLRRQQLNSQCSTRKHETPAGTSAPRGAWCSLERR